jgi:uncharacterized protein involved in outer membrane biogenesis
MRFLKFLGISFTVIVALVLAAVVIINLIPGEYFKGTVSSVVKAATGRDLVIGGDVDVELGSSFKFTASDVRFAHAEWGSRPEMFSSQRIEGELALAPLIKGLLDVRLVLISPDLLLETDPDGRGNWEMGAEQQEAVSRDEAPADSGSALLRPFIRELRLEQVKVAYLGAATGRQHHADFDTILLRSQGDSVSVQLNGRFDEHELTLTGGVDEGVIGGADQPAGFTLSGRLGDIRLQARGMLDAISTAANVDLVLEAKVPSLAALTPFVGSDLPDQGPLDASLRISGASGDYRADDIKVNLGAEMLTAAAEGVIADLAGLSGIELDLVMDTAQLPDVAQQIGIEVPVALPAAVNAEAKLSGSLDALALPSYQVGIQDEGVKAAVKGEVRDLLALKGLMADLSLDTTSLAALSKFANTELPDSGPVALTGKLSSPEGLDSPSDVSVNMKGDGVNAGAVGSIADLLAAEGISLALKVEGDSLQQVARLAGQDLPNEEPMQLEGDLSASAGTYKVDKLLFKSGDNEVSGAAQLTPPATEGGSVRIRGNLHLATLDLDALSGRGSHAAETQSAEAPPAAAGTAPGTRQASPAGDAGGGPSGEPEGTEVFVDADAGTPAADEPAAKKAAKVFPSEPLPVETLRAIDADMEITADEIATRELVLKGVVARLVVQEGVLRVEPVTATVGDGPFEAGLVMDASRSPATLSVDIDMDNGTSRYYGGRYNLKVDLDGAGDSIAKIMAGLDGQVIFDIRDMDMEKSLMTDLGRGLLDTMSPFDKEQGKTKLVCAIARFDIQDGIADAEDKIVAQLSKVTWFGGGQINLKTEAIDLGAQSKARTGLGISNTGLASLLHVGGTLASPTVLPDPEGVAKKYGQYYLTVMTGGIFALVKGMWDKAEANSDVCAEVLEMGEKERTGGRSKGGETDAGGATAAEAAPASAPPVKDAGSAPGAGQETGSQPDLLDTTDR